MTGEREREKLERNTRGKRKRDRVRKPREGVIGRKERSKIKSEGEYERKKPSESQYV